MLEKDCNYTSRHVLRQQKICENGIINITYAFQFV